MASPTTQYPTSRGTNNEILIRPLTTVFTPPEDCPTVFPEAGEIPIDSNSLSCYPPDFIDVVDRLPDMQPGFYSPGICPGNYTPGCELIGGLKSDETGTACVPLSYNCQTESTPRRATSGTATAFAISIRWRQQDLIYLQTHPLSPGVTPWTFNLSSSTSSASSAPSATQKDDRKPDSKSGLSTGGVVGIAFMCLAVGLFFGFAVQTILRRRKRRHPVVDISNPGNSAITFTDTMPQVIDQTSPTELGAKGPQLAPVELQNDVPSQRGSSSVAGSSYGQPMYAIGQMHRSVSQGPLSFTDQTPNANSSGNLSPNDEMEILALQQSQLRAEKERLLKLHEIEERERMIAVRMQQLHHLDA